MKKTAAVLICLLILLVQPIKAQTYLAPVELGSGAISTSSGKFYYSASGSVYPNPTDIAYIPITSTLLSTSNSWEASLRVSIPSLNLNQDDNLSFGLAIGTNGLGINSTFVNLYFNSANHSGTTLNDVPDYTYGDFAVFSAQNGLGNYATTTTKSPFSSWNGSSYYQINGGSNSNSIGSYSSQPINGTLRLSYDGSSIITAYFDSSELGSYNISSWGNGSLVAAVYGSSAGWAGSNVLVGSDFTVVPEPSTYALFGIGAIGMLIVLRRKKTA